MTKGGLIKITVQVTQEQLEGMDARVGSRERSILVRRYIDRGLEHDRRVDRIAEAVEVA